MSLGDTISRLRAEKGLSQEALANALGVSRQSISKWETDGSVPELDKLVKLSEIFGVSLDQLVRGEEAPPTSPEPLPAGAQQPAQRQGRGGGAKVAGVVLLCMGFLVTLLLTVMGSLLSGLIFASPFLSCGVICLVARRRTGLWCGWAVYLLVDAYFRYAAGLNWRLIRFTLIYEPQWNYVRLATAWAQFLGMVLLIVLTVCSYRKERLELTGKRKPLLLLGWAALILGGVLLGWYTGEARMYAFFLTVTDNLRLVLLTVLLTVSVRAWKSTKEG